MNRLARCIAQVQFTVSVQVDHEPDCRGTFFPADLHSQEVCLPDPAHRPDPRRSSVYHHIKKLMYTVKVGTPDPRFGKMLLEQFGGANGELAAAMQYTIQGWNCEDMERKDLLM